MKKGETIKLTLDDKYMDNCDETHLWLDYKNITKVVELGSHIYIDDGLMSLKVKEIGRTRGTYSRFHCRSLSQFPTKQHQNQKCFYCILYTRVKLLCLVRQQPHSSINIV